MLAGQGKRRAIRKLLGDIEFDMNQPNVYGLITARLSRPAGIVLAQGIFRPSEFLGEITEEKPTVIKTLGLRVVGSAVPGGPLSVCEFVPSALEFFGGEIWSGEGSLLFTGASEFSALHRLPIVGKCGKLLPSTTRRSGYVVPQKPIRLALEEQNNMSNASIEEELQSTRTPLFQRH